MLLSEIAEEPLVISMLRKLLAAGKSVPYVVLSDRGHALLGPVVSIQGPKMANGDPMSYFISYKTNDVFTNWLTSQHVQRAQLKKVRGLKGADDELCFVVTSTAHPPKD
jgi:hypothetical protein